MSLLLSPVTVMMFKILHKMNEARDSLQSVKHWKGMRGDEILTIKIKYYLCIFLWQNIRSIGLTEFIEPIWPTQNFNLHAKLKSIRLYNKHAYSFFLAKPWLLCYLNEILGQVILSWWYPSQYKLRIQEIPCRKLSFEAKQNSSSGCSKRQELYLFCPAVRIYLSEHILS